MGFKIETLSSFPCNSNPFNHDWYNMGQQLGSNCMVMFENHSDERCKYLILVNTATGERVQIKFEPDFYGKLADEIRERVLRGEFLKDNEELTVGFGEGRMYSWIDTKEE